MSVEEMAGLIASLGDQLRWADAASVPTLAASDRVLVAGMGGSGISGDIASALARVPVQVHKAYGLPMWARSSRPQLIAISYSGNTEETLSVVDDAVDAGFTPAVVSSGGELTARAEAGGWPLVTVPGGLQPRAALGYMLGSLLRLLSSAEAVKLAAGDLAASADLLDSLTQGAGQELAADLAAGLRGRVTSVYASSGITAPAAMRWKTQINENAKVPAWTGTFPELDHNEIVSFTTNPELGRQNLGIVALRDDGESSRVTARFRHTEDLTAAEIPWIGEVWSQGVSPLERILSLCAMGDLVSLEMARAAGINPMPVETIENLKRLLAEESG